MFPSISMTVLWQFHDISMTFPWHFHEISHFGCSNHHKKTPRRPRCWVASAPSPSWAPKAMSKAQGFRARKRRIWSWIPLISPWKMWDLTMKKRDSNDLTHETIRDRPPWFSQDESRSGSIIWSRKTWGIEATIEWASALVPPTPPIWGVR